MVVVRGVVSRGLKMIVSHYFAQVSSSLIVLIESWPDAEKPINLGKHKLASLWENEEIRRDLVEGDVL